MPQQTSSSSSGQDAQASLQLAAFTLQTLGQACEAQLSAGRALMQTQARVASVVGWPDLSPLFDAIEDPARRVINAGTEQWLDTAKRTSELASRWQQRVGQVVSAQATQVADAVEQGLQQFGEQAAQGINQLADGAEQQAQAVERASDAAQEQLRQRMAEPGRRRNNGQADGASQGSGAPA
jgi:hypothetical protein